MENAPGSVFDTTATHITLGPTTRKAVWNSGTDGPSYALETDNLVLNTTTVAATASIDAAALLGQDVVNWSPSADTGGVGVFVTGRMAKLAINTTNGAIQGADHGVAIYGFLDITTTATKGVGYAFVNEAKYQKNGLGNVLSVSFFKPALGTHAGSTTTLKLFDAEMSLSGVTYTNAYSLYSPDTDKVLYHMGGVINNTKILVGNYTVTEADSHTLMLAFAGSAINVTFPATNRAGCEWNIMQGDANKVTHLASGGNTIFAFSGHTKTGGQYATTKVQMLTSTVTALSGNTSA